MGRRVPTIKGIAKSYREKDRNIYKQSRRRMGLYRANGSSVGIEAGRVQKELLHSSARSLFTSRQYRWNWGRNAIGLYPYKKRY